MINQANKHRAFVVYDGVTNSVFQSQVLEPTLKAIQKSNNLEVTLISFEDFNFDQSILSRIIPAHDKLHVIILRKLPFVGKLSLIVAAYQLKKILSVKKIVGEQDMQPLTTYHEIIARGPLAGFVALRALSALARKNPEKLRAESHEKLPSITVQARGLCAEEYRFAYATTQKKFWQKLIYSYVYKSLKNIEFEVYRNKRKSDYPNDVTIESVSPALKDYLVQNFRADPAKIIIAIHDLPESLHKNQIATWRADTRGVLGISQDALVYCYSGSYKPWQCAQETIDYFATQFQKNPNAFMLVLSQDQKHFTNALAAHAIPVASYCVLSVVPRELFKYLAAADIGLLFRDNDVINWVSRPTKMLEYQAVGLRVIHNHTVAWLESKS